MLNRASQGYDYNEPVHSPSSLCIPPHEPFASTSLNDTVVKVDMSMARLRVSEDPETMRDELSLDKHHEDSEGFGSELLENLVSVFLNNNIVWDHMMINMEIPSNDLHLDSLSHIYSIFVYVVIVQAFPYPAHTDLQAVDEQIKNIMVVRHVFLPIVLY